MEKIIKPRLKHVQFHLTNKCNLDCLFCWCHHNKNEHKDVSPEILLTYLKEVCKMIPEVITLSGGGEPLCRRELAIQMMRIIKTDYPEINGVLITNATLIDKDLAEELVNLNWDDVIISMQGPDPKINDSIVGLNGAFDKTVNGIKLIKQAKNKQCKEKPLVTIKTVITKYNYKYLTEMIEFSDGLSVDNIEFRLVNEEGETHLTVEESDFKEFLDLVKKSKEYSKRVNVKVKFEFNTEEHSNRKEELENKKKGFNKCIIPFTELVVFGNGSVSVCCNYFKEQFKPASKMVIRDFNRGVKEIWLNSFKEMRQNFDKECDVCVKCSQDMEYKKEASRK